MLGFATLHSELAADGVRDTMACGRVVTRRAETLVLPSLLTYSNPSRLTRRVTVRPSRRVIYRMYLIPLDAHHCTLLIC